MNRGYYHNLKSLLQWITKNHPNIINNPILSELKLYIEDPSKYNSGYGSLKWLIFKLRDKMEASDVQDIFLSLLTDAIKGNDIVPVSTLWTNVFAYDAAIQYKAGETRYDLSKYTRIRIGRYYFLINETEEYLTSYVFKRKYAQGVIWKRHDNFHATVAFDNLYYAKSCFDTNAICKELSQYGDEWTDYGNTLVCGGMKHPDDRTNATVDQIIKCLAKNYDDSRLFANHANARF